MGHLVRRLAATSIPSSSIWRKAARSRSTGSTTRTSTAPRSTGCAVTATPTSRAATTRRALSASSSACTGCPRPSSSTRGATSSTSTSVRWTPEHPAGADPAPGPAPRRAWRDESARPRNGAPHLRPPRPGKRCSSPGTFASDRHRQRYHDLIEELRCLVCQNQSIADSDAELAADLRRIVFEMIERGESDDAITAYMSERYGSFVLYRPPLTPLHRGAVGGACALRSARRRRPPAHLEAPTLPEGGAEGSARPNGTAPRNSSTSDAPAARGRRGAPRVRVRDGAERSALPWSACAVQGHFTVHRGGRAAGQSGLSARG